MYDPSMRVLTVLEILQARGHVTPGELVERLEVSRRTVQRYVARLQDLGIPVDSTRGRGAEYSLRPGFRMQPLMFNNEEAFVVTLGLLALQHLGLSSITPALTGVTAKLERATPVEVWNSTRALGTALQLETQDWIEPVDATIIAKLAEAIQSQRQLEVEYQNHQHVRSRRAIQPLGLARHLDTWYVAAFCMLRNDRRLFRVNGISAIHETPIRFERPEAFDMRQFVTERFQEIPTRWRTEVWLGATLDELDYSLVPAQASFSEVSDGLVMRCGVDDLERYAARLLAMGCAFAIRTPHELHDAFARVSQRATHQSLGESREKPFLCQG